VYSQIEKCWQLNRIYPLGGLKNCLRVAACLGAWFALLGYWGDLGIFARELAGLYSHMSPNLLALKRYRLCRLEIDT
jgi:hypothetical protein